MFYIFGSKSLENFLKLYASLKRVSDDHKWKIFLDCNNIELFFLNLASVPVFPRFVYYFSRLPNIHIYILPYYTVVILKVEFVKVTKVSWVTVFETIRIRTRKQIKVHLIRKRLFSICLYFDFPM